MQNEEFNQAKAAIKDNNSRHYIKELEGLEITMYEDNMYVPEQLRGRTLQCYHHYLAHPGGDRLAQTLFTVCYWKGLQNQAKQFCENLQKVQETQV